MYFAAVDVGSNSIRHLVIHLADGVLRYVESSAKITRITEGIGRQNAELGRDGVRRSLSALLDIRKRLDQLKIRDENIILFATESLRQACNSREIKKSIEKTFLKPLRILSGQNEARAGFTGADIALGNMNYLFDLGGGSLELSGRNDSFSFPLGAVRLMTDLGEDVPAIKTAVNARLAGVSELKGPLAGIGGTSSSIAMMADSIPVNAYHPEKIHGRLVRKTEIENLISRVMSAGTERKGIIGLEPGRADIILAGMTVIKFVLEATGVTEYQHSECGILWGIIFSMLEERNLKVESISFSHYPGK